MGDPLDEATDLGTLIDEAAARRVEAWVKEAAAAGAKILAGGGRKGAQVEPTLLVDVDVSMKVVCEEVFGPVLSIQRYDDIDTIFKLVSDLDLGLQCGIFTNSMPLALRAVRSLRTGGVVINGPSSWRTDQMPYGGIKNSGIGREGPRYAVQEMTDQRLVIFNT
jgi:acyl-CoA reductase-like NAD-dependent aldehyde dehydrogenase